MKKISVFLGLFFFSVSAVYAFNILDFLLNDQEGSAPIVSYTPVLVYDNEEEAIGTDGYATDGALHVSGADSSYIVWDRTRYQVNVIIHNLTKSFKLYINNSEKVENVDFMSVDLGGNMQLISQVDVAQNDTWKILIY